MTSAIFWKCFGIFSLLVFAYIHVSSTPKLRFFPPDLGYNAFLPKYDWPNMNTANDPLHGKKLADILDELLDYYGGFEGLSRKIEVRCFCIDPSVKSSLRFLRTTPWAREKVESLYLYVLRQKAKQKP